MIRIAEFRGRLAVLKGRATIRYCSIAVVLLLARTPPAAAGVQDWELSELLSSADGDAAVRYVELVNLAGGCLFPSSRIIVYDTEGVAIDTLQLVSATRCYAAGTYHLSATSAAATRFGVDTDLEMAPTLPPTAAQVCFVSSATRYDCVRWGSLNAVLVDFFGAEDRTAIDAPPDGLALARHQSTHVVVDDWQVSTPTPRGPNDGSPWFPPDAGPSPDASPVAVDAAVVSDARRLRDAAVAGDADPQRYLDVDPAGGATCSCAGSGPAERFSGLALLALVLVLVCRRPRRIA